MEDFVTLEIAKKLKEKGFTCQYPIAMCNEVGEFYPLYSSTEFYYDYNDFDEYDFIAPTISQVLKWLRKEKQIYVSVEVEQKEWFEYKIVNLVKNTRMNGTHVYETYEDAIIAGIEYVIDKLI